MRVKGLGCFVLFILVVCLASAQQRPSLSGSLVDWPQFNFDAGLDGDNPYETALSPATVGNVTLKWSYTSGIVTGQPVVANGVMYFGTGDILSDRNVVYAIDAETGAFIWKYDGDIFNGPAPIFGSPAVANGMVYVATSGDKLYALNAVTGVLLWTQYTGDSPAFSPTVANGLVYLGSKDKYVYAFDGTTGNQVWQYETAGQIWTPPAVANGVLYVSSGPSIVYALDASNGSLIWKKQFGTTIGPSPSLAGTAGGQSVANGVLYVGVIRAPNGYDLYALDASTGAVIWRSSTLGYIFLTTPAVGNGMVYVAGGGMVYAVNASTGAPVWQTGIHGTGYSPVVVNGVLYIGSWYVRGGGQGDGTITAMDATTGNVIWTETTQGSLYDYFPSPAVANGTIYGSLAGHYVGAWALSQ